MLPETEAIPAFPMSDFVRLRLSRIMGIKGAAAKVEMKQVKNEVQERWKVVMCGFAKEKILKTFDLCSESTGKANFVVVSMRIFGSDVTVKLCMEVPGELAPPFSDIIVVF